MLTIVISLIFSKKLIKKTQIINCSFCYLYFIIAKWPWLYHILFISQYPSLSSSSISDLCMALNSLLCADVPLTIYSLTPSIQCRNITLQILRITMSHTWWYLSAPNVDLARSCSSCDGSAPNDRMKRMGSDACVSFCRIWRRLRFGGDNSFRPKQTTQVIYSTAPR